MIISSIITIIPLLFVIIIIIIVIIEERNREIDRALGQGMGLIGKRP